MNIGNIKVFDKTDSSKFGFCEVCVSLFDIVPYLPAGKNLKMPVEDFLKYALDFIVKKSLSKIDINGIIVSHYEIREIVYPNKGVS